jgi:hypothetical protein
MLLFELEKSRLFKPALDPTQVGLSWRSSQARKARWSIVPIMALPTDNLSLFEETDADRRRGILADDALSRDLASALAGNRRLTEAEMIRLGDLRKSRGLRFFCKSSRFDYSPAFLAASGGGSEDLWTEVLRHTAN